MIQKTFQMVNLETYPGLKNNNKTLLDFNDKSKRFSGSSGKRPKNLQGNEIKLKLKFVKARQLWRNIFFFLKREQKVCIKDFISRQENDDVLNYRFLDE